MTKKCFGGCSSEQQNGVSFEWVSEWKGLYVRVSNEHRQW